VPLRDASRAGRALSRHSPRRKSYDLKSYDLKSRRVHTSAALDRNAVGSIL
jgi:hypothetical protein